MVVQGFPDQLLEGLFECQRMLAAHAVEEIPHREESPAGGPVDLVENGGFTRARIAPEGEDGAEGHQAQQTVTGLFLGRTKFGGHGCALGSARRAKVCRTAPTLWGFLPYRVATGEKVRTFSSRRSCPANATLAIAGWGTTQRERRGSGRCKAQSSGCNEAQRNDNGARSFPSVEV